MLRPKIVTGVDKSIRFALICGSLALFFAPYFIISTYGKEWHILVLMSLSPNFVGLVDHTGYGLLFKACVTLVTGCCYWMYSVV